MRHSWEVAEIVTLCRLKGWIQPTIYQVRFQPVPESAAPNCCGLYREFTMPYIALSNLSCSPVSVNSVSLSMSLIRYAEAFLPVRLFFHVIPTLPLAVLDTYFPSFGQGDTTKIVNLSSALGLM